MRPGCLAERHRQLTPGDAVWLGATLDRAYRGDRSTAKVERESAQIRKDLRSVVHRHQRSAAKRKLIEIERNRAALAPCVERRFLRIPFRIAIDHGECSIMILARLPA